jgi:hypothetical protein
MTTLTTLTARRLSVRAPLGADRDPDGCRYAAGGYHRKDPQGAITRTCGRCGMALGPPQIMEAAS